MLDAQLIAIIGVGVAVLAAIVPLQVTLIRRVDRLTQIVTALANHRHDSVGAPTFTLPVD